MIEKLVLHRQQLGPHIVPGKHNTHHIDQLAAKLNEVIDIVNALTLQESEGPAALAEVADALKRLNQGIRRAGVFNGVDTHPNGA